MILIDRALFIDRLKRIKSYEETKEHIYKVGSFYLFSLSRPFGTQVSYY